MIEVEVANRSGVAVDEEAAAELVRRVLAEEGVAEGEIGLVFVGADEARRLKREPLVHGLLHLLGYDHGAAMEEREAAHWR
jgi:ssRNA-specific RNase YbeY (16S rRNA maturation enzyme)